jgi:hypothetical protein
MSPARSLPRADIRRHIWQQAVELIALGDSRDPYVVLSDRLRLPRGTISLVILLQGMKYERQALTLRTGIANALQMSHDAAASVEEEI